MSLQTDSAFITALSSDKALMGKIGNRLYDTFIQEPKQGDMNKVIPYILVTFDGGNNSPDSKDAYQAESDEDNVVVSVEITGKTRSQLAEIAEATRQVIRDYFSENDDTEIPLDYNLGIGSVSYDDEAPCYWQTLTYNCVTNR